MVEIKKLQLQELGKLADKENEIFSVHKVNITEDETKSFEKAVLFSECPLPGLESRLAARGITNTEIKYFEDEILEENEVPVTIKIPIIKKYVTGILERRHSMNRSRVGEYLEAILNLNKTTIQDPNQPPRGGILSRLG
ncbi:MAG: hypothetical protein PHE73_09050 [Sulfurovaceae bacterium]|nr:hypothetical protein [Sulfurovaceae bacterium]